VSLVTVSQSAPDLSLIFLESLEYFIELYLVNCISELLLSILSKRFRSSNESNQKAIRDRNMYHNGNSFLFFLLLTPLLKLFDKPVTSHTTPKNVVQNCSSHEIRPGILGPSLRGVKKIGKVVARAVVILGGSHAFETPSFVAFPALFRLIGCVMAGP